MDDGDDELLRRCQQGEETALDLLVRRYQQRVFHLAWRVLGDAALAEEATAQTLVKIWSRRGQWRGQSAAGTWIYRIAVRTTLDVQRSQTRWWRRWYLEERTLGETETILRVPKANLKMRFTRARQKLRSLLGETDDAWRTVERTVPGVCLGVDRTERAAAAAGSRAATGSAFGRLPVVPAGSPVGSATGRFARRQRWPLHALP